MTLLRQLLTHRFDNYRLLAIMGCGLARDTKAIKDLIGMLGDPSPKVGQAALYALANIKTKECLDAIASILVSGTEEMRRTAAETLAFLPEEGHPALKEGSTVEDLLVRRAVVSGLQRVNQPWARQRLEKMEIEDGQWVVRSAATQALEEIRNPNPRIPLPLTPLTDTTWLIEFAAKLGVGVTRGRAAMNLVTQALKAENPLHRRYALYTLTRRGDQSSIPQIYQILYGDQGEEREAAYNTIWHLAAGGTELPSPIQFGLG
jgi:HEAT repeat protein